ncbi:hypothetical protein [Enterococcus faecium]|uniref:hypothetical protein n=1 Tax=Enterococcus faecium TaxID=1352 RepID=UPI00295F45F0|nr:hypothetical protein [Enterococcus faecium]WOV56331.1 hypothetical protein R5U36_13125 [Enterococcus faecium]
MINKIDKKTELVENLIIASPIADDFVQEVANGRTRYYPDVQEVLEQITQQQSHKTVPQLLAELIRQVYQRHERPLSRNDLATYVQEAIADENLYLDEWYLGNEQEEDYCEAGYHFYETIVLAEGDVYQLFFGGAGFHTNAQNREERVVLQLDASATKLVHQLWESYLVLLDQDQLPEEMVKELKDDLRWYLKECF